MKKLLVIFIALFTLAGCDNFLSPEQDNVVYNGNFWSNADDAEQAVLGTYSLYRGLMVGAQMYNRGDVTTGYFNRGWNGGSSSAFYLPGDFSNPNATNKSWGSIESYADWSNFYKVIAQANLVISKLKDMPSDAISEEKKSTLLGEAYFLRALTYYNVATIWGNAPLVLEAIESSDQVLNEEEKSVISEPRSSDIEIMEAVISDAKEAVSRLEYGGSAVRANKGSAESLLGYGSLWMAFLKERDGQNYDSHITEAVSALENVVSNGGYSYESYTSASAVQEMYRGGSSESIFELNVSQEQGESYRVDNGGIQYLTSKIPPHDGDESKDRASSINWVPYSQKQFVYPDYPQDKRADLFFEAWQSTYDEPFSDVSNTATDRDLVTWMTKFAVFTEDPARDPEEYVAYFAESNIPVFRYTGVKLLLAEAYVKNNEPGKALTIINEIRSRADLNSYSGGNILEEVLQQRTAELIGEGKIFFDYVRNNYFPKTEAMTTQRYNQEGYYWPVSSEILTKNKEVDQTPFWNGKTTW